MGRAVTQMKKYINTRVYGMKYKRNHLHASTARFYSSDSEVSSAKVSLTAPFEVPLDCSTRGAGEWFARLRTAPFAFLRGVIRRGEVLFPFTPFNAETWS